MGDGLNYTSLLVHVLHIRTEAASFVPHSLGIHPARNDSDVPTATACITIVGQSFGGAVAAAAMVNNSRVVVGVNLDGMMFGPVLDVGVTEPF